MKTITVNLTESQYDTVRTELGKMVESFTFLLPTSENQNEKERQRKVRDVLTVLVEAKPPEAKKEVRLNISQLKRTLEHKYPRLYLQDGIEFDSQQKGSLWISKDSLMPDGTEACSFYDRYNLYDKGVHKELTRYLKDKGFKTVSFQGTFFIWPDDEL